jgi:3-deoxy-manno-octulosonate cytidylyltransferase (CMP-KDO synthetase)
MYTRNQCIGELIYLQYQGRYALMNPIIMIPARLNSVRLPKKVLADIHGKPMICRVAELALQSNVGPVYVACSEIEVKEVVESMGYQAIMTDPNLPSGTDRIFEAVQKVDPTKKFDMVINVQGDLPNFEPHILKDLLEPFKNPAYQISTLCFAITNDDDLTNPNVVKAILSKKSDTIAEALYFTRSTPPVSHREGTFYHHVGIYAYRRSALDRFVTLPPSPLEKQERLEQLRALEDGMRIGVGLIHSQPMSVDTAEDLERVKNAIHS